MVDSQDTQNLKAGETLIQLEELVKRYIENINNLKNDLKLQREMFEDSFKNDEVYRDHESKANEASKIKNSTKQQLLKQILKQTSVFEISEKIKDMKFELKEMEAALSDYLQQFQKLSGSNQIELQDGNILEIVTVTRVVKKRIS